MSYSQRKPRAADYNLVVGGEEYEAGKRRWTTIGAGWQNEKSINIAIDFPAQIIIGPDTVIRLLRRGEKE